MGATTQPTGTVTFLFTDIEDHTRLWDRFPVEMAECLERHDEIVRSTIEHHHGFVFSTAGDAFSAAFPSADAAAAAAVETQEALCAEPWTGGCELRVRMGLHTGEAQERDGDYFGPAVIRAARLMSLGHGGQILASATTAGLLTERSGEAFALRSLGEVNLRGLGRPEQVSELRYAALGDVEFPALMAERPGMGNLPMVADELIGREGALADAIELVRSAALLTLTGPGGVGKTRLSIETGSMEADRFGDGVWFVPLASVTDDAHVEHALAETLGVQETAGRSLTESIVGAVAGRDLLLILDNCEHVIGAARRIVQSIVAECASVVILATSREPLSIRGEHVLPVQPLAIRPDAGSGVSPAVALFVARARAADPTFEVDGAALSQVREVCGRLDGMPLAIELAAARVRGLGIEGLTAHLDDRFRLLRRRDGSDPRHQTLSATVGWSYELLDDWLRQLFCRAGVFAGAFPRGAAEEVLAFGELDDLDVADGLAELVDKSMLQIVDGPSGRHFRMLETMRQFGDAVIHADDRAQTRSRFVDHYRAWCIDVSDGMKGPDARNAIAAFLAEFDNVREAIRLASDSGDVDAACVIATRLHDLGHQRVMAEPSLWALDLVGRVSPEHRLYGELLMSATFGCRARGDRARADELIAAFEELEASGRLQPSATALHLLAVTFWFFERTDRCVETHHRALADARAAADPFRQALYLGTLSMAQDSFDRPLAEASAREALALARSIESPRAICAGLLPLAGVVVHADPERAIEIVDELVEVARAAGILWYEATGMRVRAHGLSRAGQVAHASEAYVRALDLNGVGDFGELLWYTVLNIVEHLSRVGRTAAAATALGALQAAPAAPSDDLVARAVVRMQNRIESQLDHDVDVPELLSAGGSMRLGELIRFLRSELSNHAAMAAA